MPKESATERARGKVVERASRREDCQKPEKGKHTNKEGAHGRRARGWDDQVKEKRRTHLAATLSPPRRYGHRSVCASGRLPLSPCGGWRQSTVRVVPGWARWRPGRRHRRSIDDHRGDPRCHGCHRHKRSAATVTAGGA